MKLLSGISCCLYFEDSTCTVQCPSMTLSSSEHARCSQEDQLAYCFNHYSLPSTLHYLPITLHYLPITLQYIALHCSCHYSLPNAIVHLVTPCEDPPQSHTITITSTQHAQWISKRPFLALMLHSVWSTIGLILIVGPCRGLIELWHCRLLIELWQLRSGESAIRVPPVSCPRELR